MFHDVARKDEGVDLWDHDSASVCFDFFQTNIPSLPENIARMIANTIAYKDNKEGFQTAALAHVLTPEYARIADYLRQLVHDADCLDVMRVRERFEMRFLDLCQAPGLCDQPEEIMRLVTEARALIHQQRDLWFDCEIIPVVQSLHAPESLSRAFDLDVKQGYESDENVYTKVIHDMERYSQLTCVQSSIDLLAMPYPFHRSLLEEIAQAFRSATLVTEQVESSCPDRRDYLLMRFQDPIRTSDVVDIIYSGDTQLSQQCNESLAFLNATVDVGFRWTGAYCEEKVVEIEGFSLKITYPDHLVTSRKAVFDVLATALAKASLLRNHAEHADRMLSLLLSRVEQPERLISYGSFFTTLCLFTLEPSQLMAMETYIKDHIPPVSPLYSRKNESSINPSYQNAEAISCPLASNQKKIWLLRSDFILAVGNKNANWISFKDTSLADAIETELHAYLNWDDRYGHPSLASMHRGYDGSAYYGGYLAQRNGYLEIYTFSGRYHRSDLDDLNKERLEAYIAYYFQKAYGNQPVVFIDPVRLGSGVIFDLSIFLDDKPLPEYCMRRSYDHEKILAVFEGIAPGIGCSRT